MGKTDNDSLWKDVIEEFMELVLENHQLFRMKKAIPLFQVSL